MDPGAPTGRVLAPLLSAHLVTVSPLGLVVAQQRVVASVGATCAELLDTAALGAASRLRLPVASTRPLAVAGDALDRLRAGTLTGPVLRP